jgi:hypothetical protein
MQKSSQSQPSSIATIPAEQHQALFVLINKSRMLNGWQTRTAKELDATIQTWGEIFNRYQIPTSAYLELYQRAFDVRQRKLRSGEDVPMMDATLIVSQWTGDHGLMRELRERKEQHLALPEHRVKVCPKCYDTGKIITGEDRGSPCLHLAA